MPILDFGESLPTTSGSYTRLKNAGEKLRFRILGKAFVEGNHFFKTENGWDIIPCSRINNSQHCEHCDLLFAAIKSVPRIQDKDAYNKALDEAKKTVPGCDPAITYNFPVINRDSGEFTVFKATGGVRNKIDAEFSLGAKIMDVDFIALNTGKSGKDKYALARVDSSETLPLTEAEQKIKDNYSVDSFIDMVSGTPDDNSNLAMEANTEIVEEFVGEV